MSYLKMRALVTIAALVLAAAAAQAGDVFLGITMSPITPSMARALQLEEDQGVLVDEVVADSPADEAGLEAGDVIVAIDGREIEGSKGLGKAIRRFDPGEEITMTVVRAGERRELTAVLAERKSRSFTVRSGGDNDGESRSWSWVVPGGEGEHEQEFTFSKDGKVFSFSGPDGEKKIVFEGFGDERGYLGIVPEDVGRGEGEELGLDEDRGVVIAQVIEDGPASEAGLRDGDVIVALDGQRIDDGKDLHEFLAETEAGQTVSLRLMREGEERRFEIELAGSPGALKLADIYLPGDRSRPMFYSGTITPQAELDELEEDRRDLEAMKQELEALKQELQGLRQKLEQKKN